MKESAPRLVHHVQAVIVRAILGLLHLLPHHFVPALGAFAGALYGRVARRRYRIALQNLEKSFASNMGDDRRKQVVRSVFRHFGRVAFEVLTLDRYGPSDIGTRVTVEGLEHIRAAYARGRGVFLFSGHYGNWELVALMQGYLGFPLALITRPLDNPILESLVKKQRESSGNRVISKRNAIRHALRAISDGIGVAIVIDQNVRDGARIFVDFFGRPASTTPTLALLALKTGAPIVPVFSLPGPRGSYRIVYRPEVRVDPTGDRDRDVRTLTEACTRIVESQIREHPEFWLWMHERWKKRPRRAEWPPPA